MPPRLTIGIPTRDRPEMVARAIGSAMEQTVPVKVVVQDSGASPRARRTCEAMAAEREHFAYHRLDTGTLWGNWRTLAQRCDTEFFLWLQDDDVIHPDLAARVIDAFDAYPRAVVYCSRLPISYDGRVACSFYGSWGPKLCLDFLGGRPSEFDGRLLVPAGYFDVWAQSPAKAFRCGGPFRLMLESLPGGVDKYTEKLDIAFMGLHGSAIADPRPAGYWIQHPKMESTLTRDEDRRQAVIAFRFLDMLAEAAGDWQESFWRWLDTPGLGEIMQPMFNSLSVNRELSPNIRELYAMMRVALRTYHGMPPG